MKFNYMDNSLKKTAFNDNVRGYSQENTRSFELCVKCNRDKGDNAHEAWKKCVEEYQKKNETDWSYNQHANLKTNLS